MFTNPAGEVELGYIIGKQWWNRGYASEAATASVRAAHDAGHAVIAKIGEWNEASIRVAVRAGLVAHDAVEDDGGRLVVYRSPVRAGPPNSRPRT